MGERMDQSGFGEPYMWERDKDMMACVASNAHLAIWDYSHNLGFWGYTLSLAGG